MSFNFRRFIPGYQTHQARASAAAAATAAAASNAANRAVDAQVLSELLQGPYDFRSFNRCLRTLGTRDIGYVQSLLEQIGARQSKNNPDLWGLKSRVGNRYRRLPAGRR